MGIAKMKADVFKALAHPTRIGIVEALKDGEKCVCELNQLFDYDRTTISKHFAVLKQANIIKDRKEGLNIYYSLNMPCIANVLECIERAIIDDIKRQEKLIEEMDD